MLQLLMFTSRKKTLLKEKKISHLKCSRCALVVYLQRSSFYVVYLRVLVACIFTKKQFFHKSSEKGQKKRSNTKSTTKLNGTQWDHNGNKASKMLFLCNPYHQFLTVKDIVRFFLFFVVKYVFFK